MQAGQDREVDRRLGVARALEHAARTGAQRKDVAGLHQLLRPRLRVGEYADGLGAVVGADARRDSFGRIDAHRKVRAMHLAIAGDHRAKPEAPQLVLDGGNADDAAAIADHHVHGLRRGPRRRHDEIALVFAALIVRHNDKAARRDIRDCGFDGIERRRHGGGHSNPSLEFKGPGVTPNVFAPAS